MHEVCVLEARDRVGGRTLSRELSSGHAIDLGGQWVGPGQDRVLALADELGLRRFRQFDDGEKCLVIDGDIRTYRGMIPSLPIWSLVELQWNISRLERMAHRVPRGCPQSATSAGEWDAITVATWASRHFRSTDARAVFDMAVRSILAAEPEEVSLLYLLSYVQSAGGLMKLASVDGGAQQERIEGGAQQLSQGLADELRDSLVLGQPVVAIEQYEDGVVVRASDLSVHARYCIIAMAPSAAGRIAFSPTLPGRRQQLLQRMPMGSVIKSIAVYSEPFWRQAGKSGEIISNGGAVELGFDDSSDDGEMHALVGFTLGEEARRWTGRAPDRRRAAVLEAFGRCFGSRALEPIEFVQKDWVSDAYAQGCYVGFCPPGVLSSLGEELRTPSGRIHWAGTETAEQWCGYLDGAIRSGQRAATAVYGCLAR